MSEEGGQNDIWHFKEANASASAELPGDGYIILLYDKSKVLIILLLSPVSLWLVIDIS